MHSTKLSSQGDTSSDQRDSSKKQLPSGGSSDGYTGGSGYDPTHCIHYPQTIPQEMEERSQGGEMGQDQ